MTQTQTEKQPPKINHRTYTDHMMAVETMGSTPIPQSLIWLALHQDYSSNPVYDSLGEMTETKAGRTAVKKLLESGQGHWGPLEHPSIIVNLCWIPRAAMVQLRTHRNVSFDIQSLRYTSDKIIELANGNLDLFDEVFYLRPRGVYQDRKGHKYYYSESERQEDREHFMRCARKYAAKLACNMSEEHARDCLPTSAMRVQAVFSGNLRAMLHVMDVRLKKDVQLECFHAMNLLAEEVRKWCPQIMEWYDQDRLGKASLEP